MISSLFWRRILRHGARPKLRSALRSSVWKFKKTYQWSQAFSGDHSISFRNQAVIPGSVFFQGAGRECWTVVAAVVAAGPKSF